MKKLLIRDLTLRDGQQSQFATRVSQGQIDRVIELFRDAHFYALEVWGGAIPDSIMRYLNENPWTRLEKIKAVIGDASHLTALSRGRNLFGYTPYPESVIEGFCKNSIESGLGIMRIFDCLNDQANMVSTIKYVKKYGGMVDCAVCYTVDPKFSTMDRIKGFFSGKKIPKPIFTIDYFIKMVQDLEKKGADMITIKDMAGLIPPEMAAPIMRGIKKTVKIPIDMHTHCTPGYGLATVLVSIVNGVDIVDTCLMPWAGGPAAPAFELIQIIANKLGLDTGVNLKVISKINKELVLMRKELEAFDTTKMFPREFDLINDKLPADIDALFDRAIETAKQDKFAEMLVCCNQIEDYFNFPKSDEMVKAAEIPGGMYTNMVAQLKQVKQEHLIPRVLQVVPQVRLDAGLPPLVTPTSQIVGQQAVCCVVDENNGKPFYTTKSNNYVELVKGSYGKTPFPVDPDFREKLTGVREETPYDTSKYKKQPNPELPDFGGVRLVQNEKEELLLELFPAVAINFLKKLREKEWLIKQNEIEKASELEEEQYRQARQEWLDLSKDEKNALLDEGLYGGW